MIIKSTEVQNNFGKYLKICKFEEVIVCKNGKNIARLVRYDDDRSTNSQGESIIRETNANYQAGNMKMSYEDFLEITEASDKRYEFIDGRIYLMSSPSVTHQKILKNMFLTFGNWFYGKKCTPLVSPFDITLIKYEEDKNVVQPDIFVICDLEEKTNEKDRYMGTPVLVVEILSRSTQSRDMVLKMDLYMNSGIKEYWIINSFNAEVHLYLFENNEISETHTWRNDEIAESIIFSGLKVDLAKVFK